MFPEDPARDFVVVGNDPRAAAERFHIDVAERFPDLGVKEQIGTAVQIRHLLVFECPRMKRPGSRSAASRSTSSRNGPSPATTMKASGTSATARIASEPVCRAQGADHQHHWPLGRQPEFGLALRPGLKRAGSTPFGIKVDANAARLRS